MHRFLMILAAILTVLMVAACGGAKPAAAPLPTSTPLPTGAPSPASTPLATGKAAAEIVRVVVPDPDNLQFLNFWIAQGAGFFKEEGLDVQVVTPPNPQGAPQFLLQGRVDVALFQSPIYIQLIAQGRPILVFANLLQNDPINLVVRKEVAEARKLNPDAPLAERLKGL
jgi:ABC-type nitrate/sulfonate/bicarbonate transport system substrate-binding protein